MQTGFTSEPPRPRPADAETQLVYTLDQHDFVDCWMYEWEQGAGRRDHSSRHLLAMIVALPALLFFLLVSVRVSLDFWLTGDYTVGELLALGLVVALVLGALVFSLVPRRAFSRRERAAHLARMRQKAQELEEVGKEINRARIFWLFLTPEGMTEIAELRQDHGGIRRHDYREASVPWRMVEDIVLAERHVFLVPPVGSPWIVPLNCFPHRAAAEQFVAQVRGYLEGAAQAPVAPVVPVVAHPEGPDPRVRADAERSND